MPAKQKTELSVRMITSSMCASESFEIVATDIVGPFPTRDYKMSTERKNFYIATLIDYFNRLVLIKISTTTSHFFVSFFLPLWIQKHGTPKILISDRGPKYCSVQFTKFLERHKITHRPTSGYNPQGNGRPERINTTINYILEICKNCTSEEIEDAIQKT